MARMRLVAEKRGRACLHVGVGRARALHDMINVTCGLVAEADGNRTRRRRGAPPTGFEDHGGHQAPRRLRDQTLPARQDAMAGRAAAVLRQSRREYAPAWQ